MNKNNILLMAFLMIFIVASSAMAEIKGGEFTLSPFYGAYIYDGSQQLEPSFSTGIRLGYNLNENWGVETQFSYAALKTSEKYGRLFNYSGDLLYHFMPEKTVVPYFLAGGGWSKADYVTGKSSNGMFEYGAGIKYFVTEDVAFRFDARQIYSLSPTTSTGAGYWQNSAFNVGMSFQFGRPEAVSPAVVVQQSVPEPQTTQEGPTSWQAENTTASAGKILITGMRVNKNEFEIIATKPIRDYKIFTLSQPSRLVADIANGESGFMLKQVIINRLGVATVRFESYPDYLRIYFDAAQGRMIPYRVEETDRGLKIIVTEP